MDTNESWESPTGLEQSYLESTLYGKNRHPSEAGKGDFLDRYQKAMSKQEERQRKATRNSIRKYARPTDGEDHPWPSVSLYPSYYSPPEIMYNHDHEHDSLKDIIKMSFVREWVPIVNPVSGRCKCCGYTGIVANPILGLF